MPGKRTVKGVLLLAASVLVGGIASATVAHRLISGSSGPGPLPLVLGVVFSGLGWLLAENIGEADRFPADHRLPGNGSACLPAVRDAADYRDRLPVWVQRREDYRRRLQGNQGLK